MTNQRKILVLGASSYVGRHLCARLGDDRLISTYLRNPIDNGIYFDSLSMSLPEIIAPDAVSHAVILLGDTKPDSCAADTQKSRTLNVESIISILDYLKICGIIPVFSSTESVFDGTKGDYIESDQVNPVLTYGRQKLEIERYIQDNFDQFVIVRLALTFGRNRGDGTIFASWLDSIEQRKTIYCAHDQICSPIYIEDVVDAIVLLIEYEHVGTFHLTGHKSFSKQELFYILVAQIKKYFPVEVDMVACSIHDFPVREKRPMNLSMRPDKLVRTIGLQIKDVELVCRGLVDREFRGTQVKY